jgi:hypothetical protein
VPTLCRLEYLTPSGWVVGHAGMNLLDPGRYVERLATHNKFGRATELDESLQPTGKVWAPDNVPNPRDLTYNGNGNPNIPELLPECGMCGERDHKEGLCLL